MSPGSDPRVRPRATGSDTRVRSRGRDPQAAVTAVLFGTHERVRLVYHRRDGGGTPHPAVRQTIMLTIAPPHDETYRSEDDPER
jgi:hypothetical protein